MKFLCGIQRLVEVASPSAPPVPQVPEGAWVSQQPEVEPGCVQRPCRDKLHSKEPFSLSGCSLSSGPAALTPTWQDRSLFQLAWSWHPPATTSHPPGSHRASLRAPRAGRRRIPAHTPRDVQDVQNLQKDEQKSAALNMGSPCSYI